MNANLEQHKVVAPEAVASIPSPIGLIGGNLRRYCSLPFRDAHDWRRSERQTHECAIRRSS